MNNKISLIGAPTDIGAGTRGASMGPEALRVANIASVLSSHGLEVLDRGNVAGPANPWLPGTRRQVTPHPDDGPDRAFQHPPVQLQHEVTALGGT